MTYNKNMFHGDPDSDSHFGIPQDMGDLLYPRHIVILAHALHPVVPLVPERLNVRIESQLGHTPLLYAGFSVSKLV